MSETATKLLEQLLALPEGERLMVADQLWDSIGDEKKQEIIDEATSDPEFQAELERRFKEIEEHPENLLDGEKVMEELREHLRRKGPAMNFRFAPGARMDLFDLVDWFDQQSPESSIVILDVTKLQPPGEPGA